MKMLYFLVFHSAPRPSNHGYSKPARERERGQTGGVVPRVQCHPGQKCWGQAHRVRMRLYFVLAGWDRLMIFNLICEGWGLFWLARSYTLDVSIEKTAKLTPCPVLYVLHSVPLPQSTDHNSLHSVACISGCPTSRSDRFQQLARYHTRTGGKAAGCWPMKNEIRIDEIFLPFCVPWRRPYSSFWFRIPVAFVWNEKLLQKSRL